MWRRIKIFSPGGASTPPVIGVLDACRIDTWQIVPSVTALPALKVQFGGTVLDLNNTAVLRDPDYVLGELRKLCGGGTTASDGRRTTLKTRDGKRWSVKFDQVLDTQVEYDNTTPYGKTYSVTLTGYLMAQI